MSTPVSSILAKHFREKNSPIRAITIKTNSSYEGALKRISGLELYFAPETSSTCLGGLDFDVVISQCKTQYYEAALNISRSLHLPIISLDYNLPNSPQDVEKGLQQQAFKHIFSYHTIAQAWQIQGAKTIYEPIVPLQPSEAKIYGTFFVDIDQQTMQLAQELSKLFPVDQIKQDNQEVERFQEAAIFINLAGPSPEVLRRIRLAIAGGCAVYTWNHPLFKELVVDGLNGSTFDNPNVLVEQLKNLRSKGIPEMQRLGKASHSLIKTKFSESNFEKEWKKVLTEASNKLYLGV